MHPAVVLALFFSLALSVYSLPFGHHEPGHEHEPEKFHRQQAYSQGGFMIVNNNLGQAKGVDCGNGVIRFVVKYATASRFGNPVLATQWTMQDDPAALPPTCPQSTSSSYSEDCLYAIAYVPSSVLNSMKTAPVYMWIHGGSFFSGSATEPGLDGTKLALQMNGIVVFIQYRIGVLGFLPPVTAGATAGGNLGVKDAITALQFINNVMPFFGGNNLVTIGGQSSGAHMVRALLASPSASGLFRAATLHGDPMGYGFIKPAVYLGLQNSFYSSCSGTPQTMAVADLLSEQDNFIQSGQAMSVDPSVGTGEMLRPHVDGSTIVYSLTTTYPPEKKPLFITNNKNEAGQAIGGAFPMGLDVSYFAPIVKGSMGADRGNNIIASPWYNPVPGAQPALVQAYTNNGDVTRQALERVGTDQLWRCPNWDFARRWAGVGGAAYTALFEIGATYPDNASNSYCEEPGMVCHEDEKFIIFGSTPNPTAAQTTLTTEVQARLAKFINSPTEGPNPRPYSHWAPASTTDAKTIQFGGGDQPAVLGACVASFWGSKVPFDWQVFGE